MKDAEPLHLLIEDLTELRGECCDRKRRLRIAFATIAQSITRAREILCTIWRSGAAMCAIA